MTFRITKETVPFIGIGIAYDKGITLMLPFIMITFKIIKQTY